MSATDLELAKAHKPEPVAFQYTQRDAIIYALGVGCSVNDSLHFLYENHHDFQVFPTFVVAPGLLANSLSDWPGLDFDLTRVLHGEHRIELFELLPPDGAELISEMRLLDVVDKGSGVLMITEVSTFDADKRLLARQRFGIFQTGKSEMGGLSRTSPFADPPPSVPKDRSPDQIFTEHTHADQAALYRLGSGDLNPLHVDPMFAKASGFAQPILHGLCSLGVTSRVLLREFGGNQAANLASICVRFSSPVLPGQTLLIECWRQRGADNANKIQFQAKVLETGKLVLSSGYAIFNNVENGGPPSSPNAIVSDESRLAFREIFNDRIAAAADTPAASAKNDEQQKTKNPRVLVNVRKAGKQASSFTVEFDQELSEIVSIIEGYPSTTTHAPLAPFATITLDDDQFAALAKHHQGQRNISERQQQQQPSSSSPPPSFAPASKPHARCSREACEADEKADRREDQTTAAGEGGRWILDSLTHLFQRFFFATQTGGDDDDDE